MIQYKEFKQCKQLIGLPKIDNLDQVYNLSIRVKVDVVMTDEIGVMSIGLDRYVPRFDQSTNNCTTEKHISCDRNNNNVNITGSSKFITDKSSVPREEGREFRF
jgi:hypothetical protein